MQRRLGLLALLVALASAQGPVVANGQAVAFAAPVVADAPVPVAQPANPTAAVGVPLVQPANPTAAVGVPLVQPANPTAAVGVPLSQPAVPTNHVADAVTNSSVPTNHVGDAVPVSNPALSLPPADPAVVASVNTPLTVNPVAVTNATLADNSTAPVPTGTSLPNHPIDPNGLPSDVVIIEEHHVVLAADGTVIAAAQGVQGSVATGVIQASSISQPGTVQALVEPTLPSAGQQSSGQAPDFGQSIPVSTDQNRLAGNAESANTGVPKEASTRLRTLASSTSRTLYTVSAGLLSIPVFFFILNGF